MEDVLALYARPYDPLEPVVCMDEKSKQLLDHARPGYFCGEGKPRRTDYEYKRNGTRNIFMTVEPQGGWRSSHVTARRTKRDFAEEIERILALPRFRDARRIHVVLDNLNIHGKHSLVERFGIRKAARLMRRITFHKTPKHASWLDMAEIELSVMERQCTKQRMKDEETLVRELAAWEKRRNEKKATITWKWTVSDARRVFKYDGQN
jgi:hypothetical protein